MQATYEGPILVLRIPIDEAGPLQIHPFGDAVTLTMQATTEEQIGLVACVQEALKEFNKGIDLAI